MGSDETSTLISLQCVEPIENRKDANLSYPPTSKSALCRIVTIGSQITVYFYCRYKYLTEKCSALTHLLTSKMIPKSTYIYRNHDDFVDEKLWYVLSLGSRESTTWIPGLLWFYQKVKNFFSSTLSLNNGENKQIANR